jgi:hypothetical protein
MDDWSTIPNHRNADSEPAPDHHSTLNQPQPAGPGTKDPQTTAPAPPTRRRSTLPAANPQIRSRRTATRQIKPPKTLCPPANPTMTTTSQHPNVKNGQPALDFQRPFMDDNHSSISARKLQAPDARLWRIWGLPPGRFKSPGSVSPRACTPEAASLHGERGATPNEKLDVLGGAWSFDNGAQPTRSAGGRLSPFHGGLEFRALECPRGTDSVGGRCRWGAQPGRSDGKY